MRWFCEMVGYPAGLGGRHPDDRRLALELLRGRHGAARAAAGELPLGDDLRLRPGAPLDPEGGDARRLPRGERPGDPVATSASASGSTPLERAIARRPAQRAPSRSSSSATPARPTPARSTTSRPSRTSPRRERLWFHVDAAYGGFFVLTERGRRASRRHRARGLDRARPAQEPLPALRDRLRSSCATRETLKRAHTRSRPTTCPPMQEDPDLPDFNLALARSSRATGGACASGSRSRCTASGPSARTSTRSSTSPRWAAEELRQIPGIEILAEPQLSIVAFRLRAAGARRGGA